MKLKKSLFHRLVMYSAIITLVFFGWFYTQFENHFIFNPHIDTRFTEGFTLKDFNSVEVGMNKNQVIELLGEPFTKNSVSSVPECWVYSGDGKAKPFADFSYFSYQVCFEGDLVDRVTEEERFD